MTNHFLVTYIRSSLPFPAYKTTHVHVHSPVSHYHMLYCISGFNIIIGNFDSRIQDEILALTHSSQAYKRIKIWQNDEPNPPHRLQAKYSKTIAKRTTSSKSSSPMISKWSHVLTAPTKTANIH